MVQKTVFVVREDDDGDHEGLLSQREGAARTTIDSHSERPQHNYSLRGALILVFLASICKLALVCDAMLSVMIHKSIDELINKKSN